jgi:hypothetical protein
MKRFVFLLGLTSILLVIVGGCASFRLRKQLDEQLSQDDRFYVEIVSFDADARTATVRLVDRTTFGKAAGPSAIRSYRHDGTRWVENP